MVARSRPDYGFDAPAVPVGLGAAGVIMIAVAALLPAYVGGWWWLIPLDYGLFFLASAASYAIHNIPDAEGRAPRSPRPRASCGRVAGWWSPTSGTRVTMPRS
ncbi:MAG: hypothetical protein AUI14_09910 [Actinobacteria bacterium 13_2_20CM_2_71_6]|nr:MAG: hypothetical protein AUI14_09910 [Actinobacteria bacterium 13_2_20CM_2_71_6]